MRDASCVVKAPSQYLSYPFKRRRLSRPASVEEWRDFFSSQLLLFMGKLVDIDQCPVVKAKDHDSSSHP